jgi:hypothetical protein
MNSKTNIKLNLTDAERKNLRRKKVKISELLDFAVDEVEVLLDVSSERAKEVYALADFQRIPSLGFRSAEDLIFLGFHSVEELKGKDGATLVEAFERKKGYWIDSCVEDVFRLAVHFAETEDYSKRWWDFTDERKKYRLENGYPDDRPTTCWYDVVKRN